MSETWRERIELSMSSVDAAKLKVAEVFADAIGHGLTYRQVAEAAGMSFSHVHRIVHDHYGNGRVEKKIHLDSPAAAMRGATPEGGEER